MSRILCRPSSLTTRHPHHIHYIFTAHSSSIPLFPSSSSTSSSSSLSLSLSLSSSSSSCFYHTTSSLSSSIFPSRPASYQWNTLEPRINSPFSVTEAASTDNAFTNYRKPLLKNWKEIQSKGFNYETLQTPHCSIPQLKHGLDRVLFNPGAHFLQDPRTLLYNFDPYLQKIIQPNEINYETFSPYVIASKDAKLLKLANTHGCRFFSSTSSITGVLSQLYFSLTGPKKLNLGRLTSSFADSPDTFTKLIRLPCSIFLRKVGDHYSIDSDKTLDSGEHVLSLLGRSMESMLTKSRSEFTLHLKKSEHAILKKPIESYFFGKAGQILLRAQLDCYDPRLPRRIFDLKTRAAFPIRMDSEHYAEYVLYHIDKTVGFMGSFEREYFDMMRSAFLKYFFQVRIGQMDGIFVTYHNTARVFGFQYIPLEELDECLFGSESMGQPVFALTVQLLEAVLQDIVHRYPDAPLLRLTFDYENAGSVYIETEVDGEKAFDHRSLLTRSTSTVARLNLNIKNIVNQRFVEPDVEIQLRPKDTWNLRYAMEYEAPNESIAFDYFRVRKLQTALLAKAKSSSAKTGRVRNESREGTLTPKEFEKLQSAMKKVYLTPRLGFPVDKHGLVVDDGWNI